MSKHYFCNLQYLCLCLYTELGHTDTGDEKMHFFLDCSLSLSPTCFGISTREEAAS